MALGFVATQCTVLFVAHAVAVGGAKPALDPLFLDGCLQLCDAAVEGFFLYGGDGVAAATDADDPSSSRGKCLFKLREEFLDLVVLIGGGFGELVEIPLDDLVSVRGGGG